MMKESASALKAYFNPLLFFILLFVVVLVFSKASVMLAETDYSEALKGRDGMSDRVSVVEEQEQDRHGLAEELIVLSEKDREALYQIVEAEATSEDIVGKIMVANVILNRVESDRFPNTVYEVIHQRINGRAQFSPIADKRYDSVTVTEKTVEAVERALQGEVHTEEALFFMARSMAAPRSIAWFDNHLIPTEKHGIHEFFTYE